MVHLKSPDFYINAKVYKLCSDISKYYYIGSTGNPLKQRYQEHKSYSKSHPDRPSYKKFNEIGWIILR